MNDWTRYLLQIALITYQIIEDGDNPFIDPDFPRNI